MVMYGHKLGLLSDAYTTGLAGQNYVRYLIDNFEEWANTC